jgi:hypothetical protein
MYNGNITHDQRPIVSHYVRLEWYLDGVYEHGDKQQSDWIVKTRDEHGVLC